MTLPKGFDNKKSSYSNADRVSKSRNNKVKIIRAQHIAGGIICLVFGLIMIGTAYSMTTAWTYVAYGPLIGGLGLCAIGFVLFLRGFIK